jgi:hypothetical protein
MLRLVVAQVPREFERFCSGASARQIPVVVCVGCAAVLHMLDA